MAKSREWWSYTVTLETDSGKPVRCRGRVFTETAEEATDRVREMYKDSKIGPLQSIRVDPSLDSTPQQGRPPEPPEEAPPPADPFAVGFTAGYVAPPRCTYNDRKEIA